MKERVISQSSRLQRNRPSNCDWCNGADRQRTLFAFRCTYTCHTRISIESIAYLLIRARARNIECSFFRFFFTDFQTIKFDEKFYLSRIFAKKYISIEQRFIFIARIISTASLSHLEERKLLLLFINTCSKPHFRFILNLFYNDYYNFHFLHYRSYDLYLSKKRKETRRKEKKRKENGSVIIIPFRGSELAFVVSL